MKQTKYEPTARSVAVSALIRMAKNTGYSNIIIDKALEESKLEERDRRLAVTIFYGTLEKQLILDYYIDACLKNPQKALDAEIRVNLRAAAYQILFLEKVPNFAAVDEAVSITRGIFKTSAAGFVNGVLRSLLRNQAAITKKLGEEPALSLQYGVPEGLIAMWKDAYGDRLTREMLHAFMERPRQYIRVNPLRTTMQCAKAQLQEQGLGFTAALMLPFAAQLQTAGHLTALPAFQEGLFHVQDLSAQLVCGLLSPKPGDTVVDLCAAPGGKTFTLAEMMADRGRLYAYDLYKSRVKLIQAGLLRLGLHCVETAVQDATKLPKAPAMADAVLCDVPCSGYGVIRRKPEIRFRPLSETKSLPELQYEILCNGAKLVKPMGRLVYATCTLNPAENEQVCSRFLEAHADFIPCPITAFDSLRILREPAHMITVMPQALHSDGFFAAVFTKI